VFSQNNLADELAERHQLDLLEGAERRAVLKGIPRAPSVFVRTRTVRQIVGAVLIGIGQRVQGSVANAPTIVRWQGGAASAPPVKLRLF
jgi:hypothetical protein